MEREDIDECDSEQSSSDNDQDFSDVEEMETDTVQCLFCKQQLPTVESGIKHLKNTHSIDLQRLKFKFHMDQYSFIKLINCIRWEEVPPEKILTAKEPFWNDEKYLKPKEYESWLSYDYDEIPMLSESSHEDVGASDANSSATVNTLKKRVRDLQLLLEHAQEDMTKMRAGFQRFLEKEAAPSNGENGEIKATKSVSALSAEADCGYFNSYAHFGIHHEMLSDVVRTKSYRDALLLNKDYVSDKVVLDVGCGTSVLSIFASQAGAKNVVGIDNSDIIYNAMDIVKRNNISNVTLVKGLLENTKLPHEKFDIIVSEWMGYFLLFEGMLDSVIYARDTLLKQGGMLLPNRCTMSIVGYGNKEFYQQRVMFWDDVYGLNMSNMRKEALREPLIDVVYAEHILTKPNMIADLNIQEVDLNYSNFSYQLNLNCTKDGELSAFVGYFDTYFDLPVPVMFSTSPDSIPTHWKQVVFFLEQPQKVKVGDIVKGSIVCRRSSKCVRSLDITIEAFGKKSSYYLN